MGDLPQATVIKPKGLVTNGRLISDVSDINWNVISLINTLLGPVYHSIGTGKKQNLGQLTVANHTSKYRSFSKIVG